MHDDRAGDALALAEATLALATGDGVTEAEVLVSGEESALTRFANSEIHQNVAETQRHDQPAGRRRQAGRRRLDRPDRPRGPAPRWPTTPIAIARVVEELDDWGGLPGPTPRSSDVRRGLQPDDRRGHARSSGPSGVRAVIAAADAAGVTAYGSFSTSLESIAVANSKGVRAAGTRTTAPAAHGLDGPGRRHAATPRPAAVDASTIDAGGARPRGRRQGAGDRRRRPRRPGRLPGRARGVRGRRPPRHARLPRLLARSRSRRSGSFAEPGRRIGSELVTIVDDGHDPAGAAHGRSTSRASPSSASRWSSAASAASVVYDAQTAAAGRRRVDRPRPAGTEPVGAVPAQHGHGRRRDERATSSSAGWTAACS